MSDEHIADLMGLLEIDGPPSEEALVADWIRNALVNLGVSPEGIHTDRAQDQSEYSGNTGNLIVRLDGQGDGQRLMFSTHMDTVPDAVGCSPKLDRENHRIVNGKLGTALGGDNRTGCAALLHLARELLPLNGNHPPVTLVFFIQEEVGLVGARGLDLSLLGNPAMCYNLDGGAPDTLVTSVIGTERFTIDVTGIASHAGGRPAGGVSAAIITGHALAELDSGGWNGHIQKPEGEGSANVGTINGGQGTNVVMPKMHILAEARSHSKEFRQGIIEEWKECFNKAAKTVKNNQNEIGSVTFGPGPTYESFALSDADPVVQTTLAAARDCGFSPQTVTNNGGMDANWIVAHGIPAITFGAGQRLVHTSVEWFVLMDFENA